MDFSRRVSRARRALGLAVSSAALILLAAFSANAASLKINTNNIQRIAPLRSDPITRYWINRAECFSGDIISFPLILADYAGTDLEVWVGEGTGDCTARESRTSVSATCWRVHKESPTSNVPTVAIKVQDIAAKKKPPEFEDSVGTASDCTSTSTAAEQITLYFMLIASLDNQGGDSWATSLDLLGPSAPTGLTIGTGGSLLKATWNQNNDTDVASYRFFCDPPPGTAADADTSFGPGARTEAGSTSVSVCPDASTGDTDAGEDDASTDTCTTGGTGGSGGSGGTTTACGITQLARDLIPDPDFVAKYQCGSGAAKTATNAIIQGLTNYQPTNVAISAVDAVGNPGALSDVACGVPEPVNGFDELYRRAGGSADDGFCAIRFPREGRGTLFAGSMALSLALYMQRRRSQRPRRGRAAPPR